VTVSSGEVIALAPGDAIITATHDTGVADSASVTVRARVPIAIDVTPDRVTLAVGRTQQFSASARYEDGATEDVTNDVEWTSADASIATMTPEGLATAVADGFVTINSRHAATGLRGSARITVTPPALERIAVTPTMSTIELSARVQLEATAFFSDGTERSVTGAVIWSSSDQTVVTVSTDPGSRGLARAVAPGSVSIAAVDERSGVSSDDSGDSATVTVPTPSIASVIVNPRQANIAAGLSQPFQAFAILSDNTGVEITNTVTWASSDDTIATVDASGNVQAVAVGTVVISATDPTSGISSEDANQSATITVDPPVLLSIAISPPSAAMVVGTSQQFTATGAFTDNVPRDLSTAVTWQSSSAALTITQGGLATAAGIGNVTISASDPTSGISSDDSNQSATVLISNATLVSIAVTPQAPTIPVGADILLSAMGTYDNAAVVDLTDIVSWASSNTGVARVVDSAGARGVVSGLAAGSTVISAVEPASGVSSGDSNGSATVSVVGNISLQSIAINPGSATFNVNRTFAFTAEGTFSDMSVHPMSESVTWTSANPTVATVSNAQGTRGLATGLTVGTAAISATHGPTGIVAAQPATAQVQQGIETGDVVHYELEQASGTTVANQAPGGAAGTLVGTHTWNTTGGAPGTSAYYLTMASGSANHVVPNLASASFTNLTIDFWWRFGSGTGLSYMWNSGISFRAFTNGVAGTGIYVRATPGGSDVILGTNVQDGSWHHICWVLDATAGQARLYLDGVQVGSTTYSGAISITNWRLLGQASTNGAAVDYDRFRVWSVAKTPAEIADMVIGNH
jgi:uncharacterized protein YjdB